MYGVKKYQKHEKIKWYFFPIYNPRRHSPYFRFSFLRTIVLGTCSEFVTKYDKGVKYEIKRETAVM